MASLSAKPFAVHGGEKMIYDLRMGPQAVAAGSEVVIVYQASADSLPAHPHVIAYDRSHSRWSSPVRVGEAAGLDHHFAPILWLDGTGLWHLLYNRHFSPGVHVVSSAPTDGSSWRKAPAIAPSITYPSVWPLAGGRRLLLYRVEGHLGYWVYRLSDDGAGWGPERPLLDFDYQAADEVDRWAGSYVSLAVDPHGSAVHLGFCRWDERDGCHPRYRFKRDLLTRYNLYYLRLDPESGHLASADGETLPAPVNRRAAEACRVCDTGWELTNFPAVAADPGGRPVLVAPITEGDPWRCRFHCFRWDGRQWRQSRIVSTDNTWNAARIVRVADSQIVADLVVGEGKGEECFYGGGELERWASDDNGTSWHRQCHFVPQPGLLYNNPMPVQQAAGGWLPDGFVLYGWQGPGGVWALPEYATENRNRGQAWLWLDGHWV
jgi:hypothetical protein